METYLKILSDQSIRLQYNVGDLPIYIAVLDSDYISAFADSNKCGDKYQCHWHPDVQFHYVIKGAITFFVNGETFLLSEGQGLFINSNRLTRGMPVKNVHSLYFGVFAHPSIIAGDSKDVETYINRRFSMSNIDYIVLNSQIEWQKNILDDLTDLIDYKSQNSLQLFAKTMSICAAVCEHIEPTKLSEQDNRMQMAFLDMIGFIREHYQENLSLDDIANAGAVGRTKCCKLFKQFSNQTPNTYLTKLRLSKSTELLRDTNLSVADIAFSCGFQTPSYFISLFRREYGETPLNYREAVK